MTQYCPRCQRFIVAVDGECPLCGVRIGASAETGYFVSQSCRKHSGVDLATGTTLINGRFTVQARIGRGGFSTVYLADDTVRGEQVALKIVALGPDYPEDAARQLQQESVLHKHISDYRHVLRLYDIHLESRKGIGLLILSMEYADGGSFRKWLLDHRNDWETRQRDGLAYFKQLCVGVAAFHEAGIAHGDLKPENALFCKTVLKVADLGAARAVHMLQTSGDTQIESPDWYAATPLYGSPEQIIAAHPDDVDHRSDIYSLGVILFEILHPKGRPPFGGPPKRLRELHLQVPAPPLPDANPVEAQVVERCLAKNPADRYSSVWDLLDELEGKADVLVHADSEASTDEPDPADRAEQNWSEAYRCFSERDFNEAMRLCETVLSAVPGHPDAQRMLGDLRNRYREAEQFCTTIDRELDRRPLSELAALIQEVVEIYPSHPSGRLVQIRVHARAQEYREKIEEALAALRHGEWEAAQVCLRRAQQLNGSVPRLARAIDFIQQIQQQISSVRGYIDEAVHEGKRQRAMALARDLDNYLDEIRSRIVADEDVTHVPASNP